MKIDLHHDSVVNEATGQVDTPSEYLANLREIEVHIARCDEEYAALRDDLRAVRDRRENLVSQLRSAVRDGKVLPLLEVLDETDDGLGVPED